MRLRHRSSSGHRVIKQEKSKFKMEPVRRSTREKRLVFATLNLSEIDKQIQDPKHGYPELDSSEVCKVCVCVCVCVVHRVFMQSVDMYYLISNIIGVADDV